ncbi:MAG: hypothetical protein GF311_19190 [Candidatus Lokiarchaeota archaeon]|nr:hypothetical protein [Candidatus Lokiarchaeota archaeon]
MEKKFINPLSISLKLCALIFLILSLVFPWNNLTSEDYSATAALFINILLIAFIVGVSISFIGFLDMARINLVEDIGIIVGIISLSTQLILNLLMTVVFPSYGIRLEFGAYFGIVTILLISVDKFFLRERLFQTFFKKVEEKRKNKQKLDESEETLRLMERDNMVPTKISNEEQEIQTDHKYKPKTREKKTRSYKIELISLYSILFKIVAIIFLLAILTVLIPNLDLSDYNIYGEIFIRILVWMSIIGLLISFIGIIKSQFTYVLELIVLMISFFSIAALIVIQFAFILLGNIPNVEYELTLLIIFLDLLIISVEKFIFRSYYRELKQREQKEEPEDERKPILDRYDRMDTRADFPERWALIHGKKPTEREDFEHFQEITIEKSSSTYHPNFLHLLIQNLVEDRGFRLEISEKPLPQTDDNSYSFYDLNGSIKGSIRVKLGGKIEFASMSILLLGIGYLLTSILLLIADFIQNGIFGSISFISAFILIPLSFIFLIYYIIQSLKRSSLREIGYTNIYVLERGSAYYGREYTGKDNNETEKMFHNPAIGFKMILSFATCVKMMDIDDAKRDLDEIIGQVKNL